jgi:hypothetical protein
MTRETRQKAGRSLRAAMPGGVNVPAGIAFAVIEATPLSLAADN